MRDAREWGIEQHWYQGMVEVQMEETTIKEPVNIQPKITTGIEERRGWPGGTIGDNYR